MMAPSLEELISWVDQKGHFEHPNEFFGQVTVTKAADERCSKFGSFPAIDTSAVQ